VIATQTGLSAEWALCDLENAVTTGKILLQVGRLLPDSNYESESVVLLTTFLIVSMSADQLR
jgi:hypothetical protein